MKNIKRTVILKNIQKRSKSTVKKLTNWNFYLRNGSFFSTSCTSKYVETYVYEIEAYFWITTTFCFKDFQISRILIVSNGKQLSLLASYCSFCSIDNQQQQHIICAHHYTMQIADSMAKDILKIHVYKYLLEDTEIPFIQLDLMVGIWRGQETNECTRTIVCEYYTSQKWTIFQKEIMKKKRRNLKLIENLILNEFQLKIKYKKEIKIEKM